MATIHDENVIVMIVYEPLTLALPLIISAPHALTRATQSECNNSIGRDRTLKQKRAKTSDWTIFRVFRSFLTFSVRLLNLLPILPIFCAVSPAIVDPRPRVRSPQQTA